MTIFAWVIFLVTTSIVGIDKSNGYKVLGVFPTQMKSHHIVGSALMRALTERGHEVTVISAFPQKKPINNFRDIPTTTILELTGKMMDGILDASITITPWSLFNILSNIGEMVTNTTLQNESVQKFLQSGEKFDVVIMEGFGSEGLLGIAHQVQAPVVGFSSLGASLWTNEMVGTPSPPSYVANPFTRLTNRMNFAERLQNLFVTLLEHVVYTYNNIPRQEALYDRYFPDPKPKLTELIRNVSVVLLNNHFSLSAPRPYSVNMIEVGGLHVKRQPQPLPDNIKEFLDSAKDGAIFFSMGTTIKSKNIDRVKFEAILKVFASLKQKVLWKYEDKELPGKTPNIMISDWFPQDDILAHPNMKLFITHGGLLSTTEAIYHGVPLVSLPVFGDQPANSARTERAGIGRTLNYFDVNEDTFREVVMDVLTKDTYTRNMKKLSAIHRDQPLTPLETAIYWVEYVARHKGAVHMRAAGQDLDFIQYHNVDLFAVIFGCLVLVYSVIKKICVVIVSKILKLKTESVENLSQKKRQ